VSELAAKIAKVWDSIDPQKIARVDQILGDQSQPVMTMARIQNVLRILRSIDLHELQAVGLFVGAKVVSEYSRHGNYEMESWRDFREDPFTFFIACGDDKAQKIWTVVQGRKP
jgi:hypothetical protein